MAGGSPCGACKYLRRKCAPDCVFAPYFSSEQGPTRFAAIHKVFGASNVAKLLAQLPVHHRCQAVVTISYEAQARVRDPVYGCVSHIFALQQQVAYLQAQLMQVKAQLGSTGVVINNSATTTPTSNQHLDNNNQQWRLQLPTDTNNHSYVGSAHPSGNHCHPISPQSQSQSSLESCIDQVGEPNYANKVDNCNYSAQDYHLHMQHLHYYQSSQKKRNQEDDDNMGELQELAIRMMRT